MKTTASLACALSLLLGILPGTSSAVDCPTPNLTSSGALDQNVQKRALTNLTNAFIDLTVSVPVAATSELSNKVVAIPFRFTGMNRAYKITVDFPAQTFPFTGPSRFVAISELRGDVAQCNGGTDGLSKDILFNSPFQGPTVPITANQAVLISKFRANTTYQVELVYLFQNVAPGSTEPWRVRIEPLTGSATEIITEIPILQPLSTACDRTHIEYAEEALRAEQAVRSSLLDARIELELRRQDFLLNGTRRNELRLAAAMRKAREAVELARAAVRAGKRALDCAKERVNADDNLATDAKNIIIGDLNDAIADDDLALASLNDADTALGTSTGSVAAITAINTANDHLLNGVVSKKAALRALDAATDAGIEADNAAQQAAQLAAEAAVAVFDFARSARLIVRQGGALSTAVLAAQNGGEATAAIDELKTGATVIREAAEKHIQEVQDAATTDRVRNEADKARRRIDNAANGLLNSVKKAEDRLGTLMSDPDPTPADYLRRAKALETRLLIPILAGRLDGETRYGFLFRKVLAEINKYRALAGLPPLERF